MSDGLRDSTVSSTQQVKWGEMSDESKAVQPVSDTPCPACERGERTITPPHSSVVGSMPVHTPSGQICTKAVQPVCDARELDKFLNVPVRIGLRQQGHMDTVTAMVLDGKSWAEIGKAIGWDGDTARDWYVVEAAHLRSTDAQHIASVESLAKHYSQLAADKEAEVARLKADMRSMATMLESGEWSDILSSDEDVAALDAAISQLVSKYTKLRGDISAKLRHAAEEILNEVASDVDWRNGELRATPEEVEAILLRHLEGK